MNMEDRLTLKPNSWPNENLQSLMWVLENNFYVIIVKNNVDICNRVNNIVIPSLICYHTSYSGTIIDSFNTAL
jgi:hypothetical protein